MLRNFPRHASLLVLWLSSSGVSFGQGTVDPVAPASLEINDQDLSGYAVTMKFGKKELFKGWWKYAKEFSRTETRKDDIKHTIPSVEGESTVPIVFYSRVEAPDSLTTRITAALSDNGMSSDDITKYDAQIASLLANFRTSYYQKNLQKRITAVEKQAGKVGKELDRYNSEVIKLEQKLAEAQEEELTEEVDIMERDALITSLKQSIEWNMTHKDSVNLELEKVKASLDELREIIKGIQP